MSKLTTVYGGRFHEFLAKWEWLWFISVYYIVLGFFEVCIIYVMNALLYNLDTMNLYACCDEFNGDYSSYYIDVDSNDWL